MKKESKETVVQYELVSFGEATQALKDGKRIQRQGWNSRGLFVAMQVPSDIDAINIVPKMQSLPQTVKDEFARRIIEQEDFTMKTIHYRNQLIMVYPDNMIYGWAASSSDILEDDWIIMD